MQVSYKGFVSINYHDLKSDKLCNLTFPSHDVTCILLLHLYTQVEITSAISLPFAFIDWQQIHELEEMSYIRTPFMCHKRNFELLDFLSL